MYSYQPSFLGSGATLGDGTVATLNQKATPNFLPVGDFDTSMTYSTTSGKDRDFIADSGRIEDTLIAKGKLYDQKRETLQETAIDREGLRATPRITKMAQKIQRDSHIVKRLMAQEKERMSLWNFKLEKEALDEAKATKHWHKPEVNKTSTMIRARSATGSRFSKDGLKRQLEEHSEKVKERERLHQERLREQVEQQMIEPTNAPLTTARSTKLMSMRKDRDNTRELPHWEQMAARDEERLRQRREKELLAAEMNTHTPKITEYASNLYRNTTIQERMDMDVQAYQMTRGINQGTRGTVDIKVANPESTRRAAARSYGAKSRGASQVKDSVYERTMAKQRQRDLNVAATRLEEERNLYSPSINAKSAAMTANRQSIIKTSGVSTTYTHSGVSGQASDLLRGVGDTPTYIIRQQQHEAQRQNRLSELKMGAELASR